MLTPEQIAALRDKAGRISDPINDYLLKDIARRIAAAGQLTSTAAYQVYRAQQLGMSRKQIEKQLQVLLKSSNEEIKQLLTQAADVGYSFDLSNLPVSAVPFSKNSSVQQMVAAAVKLAQKDFTNLTQTLGFMGPVGQVQPLKKAYQSAMDYAFKQVFSGAADYNTAIRQATANLAKYGVRTIDYASGVHTSLEAATRRNIMGGLGLMQEQITQHNHDALGANGWEISAHAASAPDHEPIQGKQYSDKEYEALNNSLVRRIGTLNCGHAAFPIILGVNSPQYSEEQLRKFREDNAQGISYDGRRYTMYEATQQQRQIERAIRTQKRRSLIAEATGDKDRLLTTQIRLTRLNQEYKRFSKTTGLRTERERIEIAGFSKAQAASAKTKTENYYQYWSKSIGANNSVKSLADYYDMKYNNPPEYALLRGYAKAVDNGDISPLVGFAEYKQISEALQNRIVGVTTATGITINSFATHFIDRVIGQTSTPHAGMRCGVPIDDVLDALKNPRRIGSVRTLDDGDIRQTIYGEKAVVTMSIRDKRLIQTNP